MSQEQPSGHTTRTSTCLCRSVEVTVTGVDKGSVACHCSNCRQASGSVFAYNNFFAQVDVKVTRGQDVMTEYVDADTKSGNKIYRHFCSKCGSPLYIYGEKSTDSAVLMCGNMDGEVVQPSMEFFKTAKHAWIGDIVTKSVL